MVAGILAISSTVVTAPPADAGSPVPRPYSTGFRPPPIQRQYPPGFQPPQIQRPYSPEFQPPQTPRSDAPGLKPMPTPAIPEQAGGINQVVPTNSPSGYTNDVPVSPGTSQYSGATADSPDLKSILLFGGALLSFALLFAWFRRS